MILKEWNVLLSAWKLQKIQWKRATINPQDPQEIDKLNEGFLKLKKEAEKLGNKKEKVDLGKIHQLINYYTYKLSCDRYSYNNEKKCLRRK